MWNAFLREIADTYELSTAQTTVFLKQFSEENIGIRQTENELVNQLKGISLYSYKKFKGEIFDKFAKSKQKPDGYEFRSQGSGKLPELEEWLKAQYEAWISDKKDEVNETPPKIIKCPYKGLSAFTKDDAHFFFGREKFTKTLVDAVQQQPFVAVIGNSGSGKSSVVFAGLIPKLEEMGGWKFITFRPTNSPLLQLANALLSLLEPEIDSLECLAKAKRSANNFKTGELTLKDVLDVSLQKKSPKQRFLIFVDQFEEIYTLSPEDERKVFIDQLLEVINAERQKNRTHDIVLVITLRADFYGHAIDYQPLLEVFQNSAQKLIGVMNQEELQSVIEEPARKVGLTIQDGLTKIILDAVTSNPGELPLLEFCLEQLWEKQRDGQLTIAAYHEMGGVEKALANHAEEFYHKLNEDEQNRLKHIFTQLVRFGENTDATRRIATREQIGEKNWELVSTLANAEARLVVTGKDSKQQATIEVIHEALIRGWERLREWMEEDREFRKWQDRLRDEKNSWENSGKDNSALLRGALLVEAEGWLNKRSECIIDQEERKFILASRQYQEQEDIERIQDLLTLSQKELQLKQQLSSLVIAIKAGVKLRNIKEPSEESKINVIERLQQGNYEISEKNQLIGHKGEVSGVAFSTDGSMIASVSDDKTVKLWGLDGKLLMNFEGHDAQVWGVSFSPDGQIIASASDDRTVKLLSLDGTIVGSLEGHTDRVYEVSFSPDGQIIASASADRTVRLWNLDSTPLRTLKGHTDRVYGVSFSPNGQIIASGSFDKTVKLWNLDGTFLRNLEGHTAKVYGVSFSPDGQIIASASADRTVKLWNSDGTFLRNLIGHNNWVWGVSFSPDGQIITSASFDRTVKLWSLDGELLRILEGHTDSVYGVSFSPDGQMIASASFDKTVRLWNLNGTFLKTLKGHEGHTDQVWGVCFSPNGQILASASADTTVKLWNLDGKLLRTLEGFEGHTDRVYGVSFSPDGQIIASASFDKTVKLWSLNGTLLKSLKGHEGHTDQVWGVCFSPNGQIIASASSDRTVKLWNLDGKLLRTLEGHTDRVYEVSFSPNGQIIASASFDRTVRLWNLDGILLRTIEGHTDRVYGVSFSPDGQIIASASADRTVRLWNLDGTLLRTIEGHTDRIWRVSFSPYGQIIASASDDRTVKLWNLDGTLLRTLEGHTDSVYGVSFSPDGQIIASASFDKTVRLWPIDPEDLILDVDVKLNNLLKKGCNWIKDYLKTNPNVSESDRHLCDDICP